MRTPRERAVALYNQGLSIVEVAKELDQHPQLIGNLIVNTPKRAGAGRPRRKMPGDHVAKNMRLLNEQHGFTRAQIAEMFGCSITTVNYAIQANRVANGETRRVK